MNETVIKDKYIKNKIKMVRYKKNKEVHHHSNTIMGHLGDRLVFLLGRDKTTSMNGQHLENDVV